MEKGWIFTASEILTAALTIVFLELPGLIALDNPLLVLPIIGKVPSPELKVQFGLISALAFISLKSWEMVDIWMLPSHYKIVKENPIQIKPLAYYTQNNMNLGLSLQYKF